MRNEVETNLKVYPLWREDIFRDIARIPRSSRGKIREGSVCSVSVGGKTKYLIVRGLEETLPGAIMLDALTREEMGDLQEGFCYDFIVREAGPLGQIKWACTVADRGARISAWIGVISVVLGLVGVALGSIGVWIAMYPLPPTQP